MAWHVPVQPWLAQTSVYVLPSYYREGVPRSTQEAMAMGRAVITTDAPCCREGDVANRLFGSLQVDSSKAGDLLGWQPVITMAEQLHKTVAADLKNETTL